MTVIEHKCEFEFIETEDRVLAFPFWPGYVAGTEGYDMDDAIDMARDLLCCLVEDCAERGEELPQLTFGHEPERGGVVMEVSYSEVLR